MPDDTATAALRQSCWLCSHYRGMTPAGIAARCGRDTTPCTHTALGGCAWFCRMPGADDRLTPPAAWRSDYLGEVWGGMIAAALATEAAGHEEPPHG